MRNTIYLILLISVLLPGCGKTETGLPVVSSGKIERLGNFRSEYIAPRNIDIWLPDGYDKSEKYAVIYMNDGQMLFDSTKTWNKQEWKVDEVLSQLGKNEKLKKCIVVGIFNNAELRFAEYFPQVALMGLKEPASGAIVRSMKGGKALSDNYLKFIVEELKPAIDSNFCTLTDPADTYIMGSSMGGLISLYALCRYPEVFGGAACMSTHWPMIPPGFYTGDVVKGLFNGFRSFLGERLPYLHKKKIYFDFGTLTLDSLYKPYQSEIDSLMVQTGFSNENWKTEMFVGQDHSERSWASRLNIPFEFLLSKK